MIDERRVRLPPHARGLVEEAQQLIDQALDAGRLAMQRQKSNPVGAALDLAQQQDLMHQAKWTLSRACIGVPGVEEQRNRKQTRTASAQNTGRSMGAHE